MLALFGAVPLPTGERPARRSGARDPSPSFLVGPRPPPSGARTPFVHACLPTKPDMWNMAGLWALLATRKDTQGLSLSWSIRFISVSP